LTRPGTSLMVLLSLASASAAFAFTGLAPASASRARVACTPWQALHVTGTFGRHYVVRNKPSINHNDRGMCVSDRDMRPGFTVTRSPGTAPSYKVRAYPYIGTGCFEHACAGSGRQMLPRAGSLGNYTVHWATVTPRHSGVWNVSLDMWLGPRSGVGAAEVMIWLRYSKPSWWVRRYPKVTVDGAQWYEVTRPAGPGRHYLSFRRARPVSAATLRIAPFMAAAERFGTVKPSMRLWSTQAGFEIWSGGKGLEIKDFSVHR
jgi:hypothetical protein